ncbi:S-layer protein domain-containing protein [Methanolobus mangrovi]|uniref:S-layer protein domain-containing protein n=1 Tax=Methanolobus mangrovi TaxID=3072977 RepID=A0AA51UFZ5_9EURY|nr:S-layer protein domain-containing protein [Methanolobus mangrovi]WMW22268.1 S-layer protein domain-containing protein [Methanolobus mangrovi]
MTHKSQKKVMIRILFMFIFITVSPSMATTVDIRGTPQDTGSVDAGNISWDYSTFPGLYYSANKHTQLTAGSGEHLYFADDGGNPSIGSSNPTAHIIDEGELIYITSQVASKYKVYSEEDNITKVTKFYTLSLFGTSYCAVDNDATNIAKILIQQGENDKKTLKSGEKWEMKGGYSLVLNAVDIDGGKCYLTLYKNEEELDTGVISTDGTNNDRIYSVEEDCADGSEHIYFLTYVDSIFAGQEDNFAVLKYTWLADKDSYVEVQSGDEFGNFEVDEALGAGLVLSNSKSITITVDAGATTLITGDWYFKSSDSGKGTNGGYILYPIKRVTIEDSVAEAVVVDEVSEEEELVIVDVSSDTKETVDISNSILDQTDVDDDGPVETLHKSSIPGFEGSMSVLAISMVFFLRRYY